MNVLRAGLLTLLCLTSVAGFSKEKRVEDSAARMISAVQPEDETWKTEVSELDKEIDKLVNQRNLYLARATRLQNQGDRLQFENDDNLIDARRAWQQAQIHREIATRIQEQIDALEQRKQQILEAHGVRSTSK